MLANVRNIGWTILFSLILHQLQSQETTAAEPVHPLTGFKYGDVETLLYKDNGIDIYGVSTMIRQHFSQIGLTMVGQNKESWPEELVGNPCLLYTCRIDAPTRMIGRQKVTIDLFDCNGKKIYTNFGVGNAEGFIQSFRIAIRSLFKKDLDAITYSYNSDLTPIAKAREIDKIEQNEDSAVSHLDSHEIAAIEGIYQWKLEDAYNRIVVRKSDEVYKAIVLDSNVGTWAQGEVMGEFEDSAIPNVYNVKWADSKKVKSETIGFLDPEGDLSIELKGANDSKTKLDFSKVYPK